MSLLEVEADLFRFELGSGLCPLSCDCQALSDVFFLSFFFRPLVVKSSVQ